MSTFSVTYTNKASTAAKNSIAATAAHLEKAQSDLAMRRQISTLKFIEKAKRQGDMVTGVSRSDQRHAVLLYIASAYQARLLKQKQHMKKITKENPSPLFFLGTANGGDVNATGNITAAEPAPPGTMCLTEAVVKDILNDADLLMKSPVWDQISNAAADSSSASSVPTAQTHPYLFTMKEINKVNLHTMPMAPAPTTSVLIESLQG